MPNHFGDSIQIYTVPILPFTVLNGRISFLTIKLHVGPDKVEGVFPGERATLYLDSTAEPKFEPSGDGGWQSPPSWKVKQIEESGNEVDFIQYIKCKCQSLRETPQDEEYLEQFGHTSKCEVLLKQQKNNKSFEQMIYEANPQMTVKPYEMTVVSAESVAPKPNILSDLETVRQKLFPPEKPAEKDFCPEGGIPVNGKLPFLVASLEGTQLSIAEGIEAIKWKEPFNESVIAKELAKYHSFTTCISCNNWAVVGNIMSPRCPGCAMQS